jgi:hypothetical protein
MRYFFDCEFDEDGETIRPLSIGIIAEDGRTFYAEWQHADLDRCNDFVKENVLPHMKWLGKEFAEPGPPCMTSTEGHIEMCDDARMIRLFLEKWIGDDKDIEFWAYYGSYDWIVVCQLFGKMIDLPRHWPKYVLDIVQRLKIADKGGWTFEMPKQEGTEHHALADAEWNRDVCYVLDQVRVP